MVALRDDPHAMCASAMVTVAHMPSTGSSWVYRALIRSCSRFVPDVLSSSIAQVRSL